MPACASSVPPDPNEPPDQAAIGAVPWSRYAIFAGLTAGGCLADLVTKSRIFDWLGLPGEYWVWQGVFGFQTSLNHGGLFGFGQGLVGLLAALSVVAAVAILAWLFVAGAARDLLLTIALGLVMAGILGNLYDRLGFSRYLGRPLYAVRDWILVMIFGYHWPNFNLADSMLVCGAGMLVWHAFRQEDPLAKEGPAKHQKGSA